jgi:hypothetical protein
MQNFVIHQEYWPLVHTGSVIVGGSKEVRMQGGEEKKKKCSPQLHALEILLSYAKIRPPLQFHSTLFVCFSFPYLPLFIQKTT